MKFNSKNLTFLDFSFKEEDCLLNHVWELKLSNLTIQQIKPSQTNRTSSLTFSMHFHYVLIVFLK